MLAERAQRLEAIRRFRANHELRPQLGERPSYLARRTGSSSATMPLIRSSRLPCFGGYTTSTAACQVRIHRTGSMHRASTVACAAPP